MDEGDGGGADPDSQVIGFDEMSSPFDLKEETKAEDSIIVDNVETAENETKETRVSGINPAI